MKKYIIPLLLILILASCKDFLHEEQVSVLKYDYYESETGIEDLIRSCYAPLRYKTNYEQAYAFWNIGTDEYMKSDETDFYAGWFNDYSSQLDPVDDAQISISGFWDNNYNAIDRCNVAIDKIPLVTGGTGFMKDQAGKDIRMAEARFLRAYYYFQLVQQFGDIPLTLEPSAGLELEWPRIPVAEVYDAIIEDLIYATQKLPETQDDYGRATANAARHYLAKVYLTRGSAVTEERGQQPTDMDSAAYYADLCINSGNNALLPDFADVFDIDNQVNDEIVFATQFNDELTLLDGNQNRTHLFWLNQYDRDPGMFRRIEYGRPYRRMYATDYALDIHDRYNDSRLRKSLLTVFFSTDTISTNPALYWTKHELVWAFHDIAPDTSWAARGPGDTVYVGTLKFALAPSMDFFSLGDTALVFLLNDRNTTLTDKEIIRRGYTIYARYYWLTDDNENPIELLDQDTTITVIMADGDPNTITINAWRKGKIPSLFKYIDYYRSDKNQERGTRDVFNARLSETYLISAEAHGRTGNYATAVERINTVRRRAAYHSGEEKPLQWWKFDGGTPGNTDGHEAAMEINASYWDADVPVENYPPYVATKEDRFIHFILNERCRELLGEMHRWEDLVRVEQLYDRCYLYNDDIILMGTMRETHRYRPIPQTHLDLIQTEGRALSDQEKIQYQNPGY
ncbi:MAG: RagB/SusD family nutrient uptake outer membrane protein [Bacteroidales bacterium]|nr:MAG: RagB/SusD family nutrient uptake outer membrane protein [Bacteroidales bacterium]